MKKITGEIEFKGKKYKYEVDQQGLLWIELENGSLGHFGKAKVDESREIEMFVFEVLTLRGK